MKILMDADCLIKLIKAGLKESICEQFEIFVPFIIKKEVVDAGKTKELPDAKLAEKNIEKGIISVVGKQSSVRMKGDQALIENFKQGEYNAIATDDAKLTRLLRATGIPYILPGFFIYSLYQRKIIDGKIALKWLEDLSNFVSEDEYSMIRFLLEGKS